MRLIGFISFFALCNACHYKERIIIPANDPNFEFSTDVYNWDESMLIFDGSQASVVLNYKGEVCNPDIVIADPDYGPGVGAAESNGGILVCGGESNIWKGPGNPMEGGQCCFWITEQQACIQILPWESDEDKLGFGQQRPESGFEGHIKMASYFGQPRKQSFIFAFAQKSGEIAVGYFERVRRGFDRLPRVKWFWSNSSVNQFPVNSDVNVPVENPCILVHDYSVFVIGGRNINGDIIGGTWYTTYDLIPDQVPTNLVSTEWSFTAGFPQVARTDFACFVEDETKSIVVAGGKTDSGVSKSIELISISALLTGDFNAIQELSNGLSFNVESPKAVQLFDDGGRSRQTYIIGNRGSDAWVEKRQNGNMTFRGNYPCHKYGSDEEGGRWLTSKPLALDMRSSAFGVVPGIAIQHCQNKLDIFSENGTNYQFIGEPGCSLFQAILP